MTTRRVKTSGFTRRLPRVGIHIRTSKTGLLFLYFGEHRVGRYYPDRQAVEIRENGRAMETTVIEMSQGLQRLVESVEG
jgi:hypothetical protein